MAMLFVLLTERSSAMYSRCALLRIILILGVFSEFKDVTVRSRRNKDTQKKLRNRQSNVNNFRNWEHFLLERNTEGKGREKGMGEQESRVQYSFHSECRAPGG